MRVVLCAVLLAAGVAAILRSIFFADQAPLLGSFLLLTLGIALAWASIWGFFVATGMR